MPVGIANSGVEGMLEMRTVGFVNSVGLVSFHQDSAAVRSWRTVVWNVILRLPRNSARSEVDGRDPGRGIASGDGVVGVQSGFRVPVFGILDDRSGGSGAIGDRGVIRGVIGDRRSGAIKDRGGGAIGDRGGGVIDNRRGVVDNRGGVIVGAVIERIIGREVHEVQLFLGIVRSCTPFTARSRFSHFLNYYTATEMERKWRNNEEKEIKNQ